MNFLMFVIALTLPFSISGNPLREMEFGLNKIIGFVSNSSAIKAQDNFTEKVVSCVEKIETNDPEFLQCLKNEGSKLKGISSPSDPKFSCCARVVIY